MDETCQAVIFRNITLYIAVTATDLVPRYKDEGVVLIRFQRDLGDFAQNFCYD